MRSDESTLVRSIHHFLSYRCICGWYFGQDWPHYGRMLQRYDPAEVEIVWLLQRCDPAGVEIVWLLQRYDPAEVEIVGLLQRYDPAGVEIIEVIIESFSPNLSLITHHLSLITYHSSLITYHSSLITPHSSLITPHSSLTSISRLLAAAYSVVMRPFTWRTKAPG